MTKLIGLFGVSGVGKTRLAAEVAERLPGVLHLQASQLLKQALGQSGEALRTSSSNTVEDNQLVLPRAFAAALASAPHGSVVIDAHSVIDTDEGYVDVPLAAIAPLGLTHILFLEADPDEIFRRRAGDARKRPERSAEQLGDYQNHAERTCRYYACELGLPYIALTATDAAVELERILR
jgi:adenylate kinase